MIRSLEICVLAFSALVGEAQTPITYTQTAGRALPDDNLSYPALITSKAGMGTGFFMANNGFTFLITAKHVLFDPATNQLLDKTFSVLAYSEDLKDDTPNTAIIDTEKLGAENIIPHRSQDVVAVKMYSYHGGKVEPLRGVTATFSKSGIVAIGPDSVKRYDDVLIGNEVILMGYPTSLGLKNMPQVDLRRPLLRKGIVAGHTPQTRSIILDCPAYFGNSGGPVIEVDDLGMGARQFKVIGVVDQYVPYADGGKTFLIMANSGYSVVTPMDFVAELIK
jgi:hypothetical protein